MAAPYATLSLLSDEQILGLKTEVSKLVEKRGINSIIKRVSSSSAGGSSTTHEFNCTLNELSQGIISQLQVRGLLKHAGVRNPRRRGGINPSGLNPNSRELY
jgi:hypothetical protein